MERTELVAVVAGGLFAAFVLGFVANWIVTRLSRVSRNEVGELDQMAQALHRAEDQRDRAIHERETSERHLQGRLAQSEAELRAAMEGLREARQEAEELRAYLSEQNRGRG